MGVSGLGSLLVREGLLTETDRKTISGTCGQSSWAFAKTILAMGLLDEDELAAFFADHTRYLVADRNFIDQIDNAVLNQIDARMIARLEMLPVQSTANGATVAVVDPLDRGTIRQFEFFTGLEIEPIIAPVSQIYEGLTHLIDDFEPYDTNLQKFLKNHAATSWQRQRIQEDSGLLMASSENTLGLNRERNGAASTTAAGLEEEPFEDVTDSDNDFNFDDHDDIDVDLDDPFDIESNSSESKSFKETSDFDLGDDLSIEDDFGEDLEPSDDFGESGSPAVAKDMEGNDGLDLADDLGDLVEDEFAEPSDATDKPAPVENKDTKHVKPLPHDQNVFADSHVDDNDPFTASGDVFAEDSPEIHEKPDSPTADKNLLEKAADNDDLAEDVDADELAAFGLAADDIAQDDELDSGETNTDDDVDADELAAFGLAADDITLEDEQPDVEVQAACDKVVADADDLADELAAFGLEDDELEDEELEETVESPRKITDTDIEPNAETKDFAESENVEDPLLDDEFDSLVEGSTTKSEPKIDDIPQSLHEAESDADLLGLEDDLLDENNELSDISEKDSEELSDGVTIKDDLAGDKIIDEPDINTLHEAPLSGKEPLIETLPEEGLSEPAVTKLEELNSEGSDDLKDFPSADDDFDISEEADFPDIEDETEPETPLFTKISPLSAEPSANDRWDEEVNEFDGSDLPETFVGGAQDFEGPAITSQPRSLNVTRATTAMNKGLVKISFTSGAEKALQVACDHLKEVFTHGAISVEKKSEHPLVYAWHHGKTLSWNPTLGAAIQDFKLNEKWELKDLLFPSASEDPATKAYQIGMKHKKFEVSLRFSGWTREELGDRPREAIVSLLNALLKKSVI